MKLKPRDPKRIKKILKLVEKVWIEQPDFRLLQLLISVTSILHVSQNRDLFYVEDNELEACLMFRDAYIESAKKGERVNDTINNFLQKV